MGSDVGEAAILGLSIANIPEPFCKEGAHAELETGGLGENLDIAHPTEALVTLRAIGGDAVKIAAQGPLDGAHDAVEKAAGAFP